MILLLMTCIMSWTDSVVATTQLSEGPVSTSVLVGETSVFHCKGSGFAILWTVDGFSTAALSIDDRGILQNSTATSSGTVQSTLTVPATLVNNGTTVQCRLVLPNGMFVFSNNATLIVLPGIGPVVNVRFTDSFSAVLWDPPATAGVLSGLSYRVIVMNNNTGQVIISDTTTNTIYPLPGAPTPCQYYTANVTAFSSEYYSEIVVIGQRTTGDHYEIKNVSDVLVAYFNSSHCSVIFKVSIVKRNTLVQACPDQELITITYPMTNISDKDSHEEVAIAETGVIEYITSVEIGCHCLSDMMILDDNELEVERMTIPFSSFNVQNCDTSTDNTVILVKCKYFINSTATGYTVIENNQTMATINGSLQRLQTDSDEGYINITSLPAGKYTLKVYDSEIDFSSHKRPAYVYDKMLHILSSLTTVPSNAVLTSSIDVYHSLSTIHVINPSMKPNITSANIAVVVAPTCTCVICVFIVVIIAMIILVKYRKHRTILRIDESTNKQESNSRYENSLQPNLHSNLPHVQVGDEEVEPVYSIPRRHVAAYHTKVKRSLHYAKVDHSVDAPAPPLAAEPEPVQYATIAKQETCI